MKKSTLVPALICVTLLCCTLVPNAGAALFTGCITSSDGLSGSETWSDVILNWTVNDTGYHGDWKYQRMGGETIVSDGAAMWNYFYSKPSRESGEWRTAYSAYLGMNPVVVPDTALYLHGQAKCHVVTPLPAAFWFLGSGLIGLAGWNRKVRNEERNPR